MERSMMRVRSLLREMWAASAPLTAAGMLMLVVLVASVIGLLADPRSVTGAPVWLKPAKFAISTAIYMLTLAWLFTVLPEWRRTRQVVGWVTAVVLVLEVAIIDVQAWRGTTSHFNVGTRLDGVLFSIMGVAIVVQTLTSIAVAVALWRQRFEDRAFGWALRWAMSLTIVGASTGGLMTQPTRAQLEAVRAGGRLTVAGAHTVGAPDGGPGLPGTGWSVEHGDLRVPHFVGLHAIQLLPLLALAIRRRHLPDVVSIRLVTVATASYASLFGILLWQALRAQSITRPDLATLTVLAAWATLTAVGAWVAATRQRRLARHAVVIS